MLKLLVLLVVDVGLPGLLNELSEVVSRMVKLSFFTGQLIR